MSNFYTCASSIDQSGHWGRTSLRLLIAGLAAYPLLACGAEPVGDEELAASQEQVTLPVEILLPSDRPPRGPRPNPEDLVEITAGNSHTCVRKRNGNMYCWGKNDLGQAGQPTSSSCRSSKCVNRPRQVTTTGFVGGTQIDAGDEHVCALDGAGKAFCWGAGGSGQLGMGGTPDKMMAPIAVSGGLTFTSISAGTLDSCGTTADGLFCWGFPIASNLLVAREQLLPLRLYTATTGLAPTGVSVGVGHVCAQWVSGATRETNCWGADQAGQTGVAPRAATFLGQGPGGVGFDAPRVTTQNNFTCVDQVGPNVVCFGAGANGQLGNGMNVNASTPQQVGGVALPGGPPALALRGVSTGQFHACALSPAGAAYCWGNGNFGQLGNGFAFAGATTGTSSNLPVPVRGGLTFRAIAAGGRHTCAIGTDNGIYCWGSNYNGELGIGGWDSWFADPVRALDPQ